MNAGKVFENDYIKSLPEYVWHYRLRDSAGAWQGGDAVRFTASNICDFMLYSKGTLYLMELKSHKGKSIPLNCIKLKHLEDMCKAEQYSGIQSNIIFNFRDVEETYQCRAAIVLNYMNTTDKKSIPISFIKEYGILIQQEKKKVHYRYKLESMF